MIACTHATFLEPKSILYINFRGKLGFTDSKRVARAAVELPAGSVSSAVLAAETQTPLTGCTLQKGLAQVTLTDVLTINTFCLCDLRRCHRFEKDSYRAKRLRTNECGGGTGKCLRA